MTDEELAAIEQWAAAAGKNGRWTKAGLEIAMREADFASEDAIYADVAWHAVPKLIAEVRRLRALPVIETCGDCSACRLHQRGGVSFSEPRTETKREHWWLCHHDGAHVNADRRIDAMASPPSWCPIRPGPHQR